MSRGLGGLSAWQGCLRQRWGSEGARTDSAKMRRNFSGCSPAAEHEFAGTDDGGDGGEGNFFVVFFCCVWFRMRFFTEALCSLIRPASGCEGVRRLAGRAIASLGMADEGEWRVCLHNRPRPERKYRRHHDVAGRCESP